MKKNRQRSSQNKHKRKTEFSTRLQKFIERWWWLFLVLIALIAIGLRTIDLRADPPPDLSWSSAIYSDEAHNTYSARNWALYGKWQVDDYIPYVVYPWLNIITGIIFKLFGIGFVQLKIVSLIAGILIVLVVYFFTREIGNAISGLVAALLSAFCFPLVMYSRLGLAEISQVLFIGAAGLFLLYAEPNHLAAIFSGITAIASVLFVKVSSIFCPVAILSVFLIELIQYRHKPDRMRILLRQLSFWTIGALICLILWSWFIFLPHRTAYLSYVFHHSLGAKAGHPDNIIAYIFNAFSVGAHSKLLSRLPLVAVIGFAALPLLNLSQTRPIRYLLFLLIAGVAMLGYQYYHPPRYELFTIFPLIVAFALIIHQIIKGELRIAHPSATFKGVLAYTLWLWPLFTHIGIHSNGFWGIFKTSTVTGILFSALVVAFLINLLLLLNKITGTTVKLTNPTISITTAIILLLLVIGNDLNQYKNWFLTRTHNMFTYSRDLDSILPGNSVLAGFWAPALLATSHKRALFVSETWQVNLKNPISRYGVTHLIAADPAELQLLDIITEKRSSQSRILRCYHIRDRELIVLELTDQTDNRH